MEPKKTDRLERMKKGIIILGSANSNGETQKVVSFVEINLVGKPLNHLELLGRG